MYVIIMIRIVSYIKRGLFCFRIGHATVDFVYVDNLVHCHLLAAKRIAENNNNSNNNDTTTTSIGGRAYFCSDQHPILNFEFFRSLLVALGYPYPDLCIPTGMMYYIAWTIESIHKIINPIYPFQPLMTRAEVWKVGVTHYMNPKRAQ